MEQNKLTSPISALIKEALGSQIKFQDQFARMEDIKKVAQ